MNPIDHPVSRHAIDVVEGREVAGELVTLACQRHLDDLETGRDRGLTFDCEAANLICNFAGMLQHTQGPLAGKPLTLEPWQVFRHGSVFGWKFEDTGLRRFKDTYHQVGKKNGKTTDTAIPLFYTQVFDGEGAPEAYCTATTRDQAGLLFKGLKRIIKRSSFLPKFMDVTTHQIDTPATDGIIKCLSRDGDSSDGINPSFIARDEMHRWTDRELAETIVESMIARSQPIDWVITTAGHDRNGLCGELRGYSEQVVRGTIQDDRLFAYVAEPPKDADPMDPIAWKMGNPNLDVSKPSSEVEAAAKKASAIAAQMPNFKRFHLNLWTEGAEEWISSSQWNKGRANEPFSLDSLKGLDAWVGLDLSNKIDTTAIVVAVKKDGEIFVHAWIYLPSGDDGFVKRAQREKREYVAWRDQGHLEVHHGGTVDEQKIINRLMWIKDHFNLQEVAFDPWGMKDLANTLDDMRFPMIEHRQGFASMSGPMKRVEENCANNKIRHGGNPALEWQIGNVHRDEDPAENIKPNKRKSRGRIDAPVAMIMAVGRATANEQKKKRGEVRTI